MNETLLWLLYFVGGILAFAAVYRWSWGIFAAASVGGLLTGAGWALLYHFTAEEKRPPWVRLDLALNLTFGLIFAAAGAILANKLIARRGNGDDPGLS